MKNVRSSRFLRRARIEPHDTGFEVDLLPLERQHFAPDPSAGDVRECDHGPRVGGQVSPQGFVLVILEEAGAHVVLLEHADMRGTGDLLALDGQGEHALERRALPIDGGVCGALGLALGPARAPLDNLLTWAFYVSVFLHHPCCSDHKSNNSISSAGTPLSSARYAMRSRIGTR